MQGDTKETLVSCIAVWGSLRRDSPMESQLTHEEKPSCQHWLANPLSRPLWKNLLDSGRSSTTCTFTWHLMTTSQDPEQGPPEWQTHRNHEIDNKQLLQFAATKFLSRYEVTENKHIQILHTRLREASSPPVKGASTKSHLQASL